MNNTPVRYRVGDLVRMRKEHPCGSDVWEILRVGMDFRLKCLGCGHIVMLARPIFERGVKELLPPGTVPEIKLRPRPPVRRGGHRPGAAVRPNAPGKPGAKGSGGPERPAGLRKTGRPGKPAARRRPEGAPPPARPAGAPPPVHPEEDGE